MSYIMNLLADNTGTTRFYELFNVLSIILIVIICIAAIATIVLILMQPSNSTGIDALGGSSETFFGKNKGKSIEVKMKRWTWICLAVLVVASIVFFILHNDSIWL